MFRDQVGILTDWFKGWNECEQTVALLSLLKRVSRTQARFLHICLEHWLADCTEIHILEAEANNAGRWTCISVLIYGATSEMDHSMFWNAGEIQVGFWMRNTVPSWIAVHLLWVQCRAEFVVVRIISFRIKKFNCLLERATGFSYKTVCRWESEHC